MTTPYFLHGRTQQVLVEGCAPKKLDVLSGVPQGTVLGPLLVLIYINDLPTVCKSSTANLFADDTLLYMHIANDGDSTKLQDLTALEDRESKWQMSFHPEKYTVLRMTTNKRYRRETSYFLHGLRLQVTDNAKYLGVTLSDDLQWEKHTQATAANASRTFRFLRRNLRDCSKQVRSTTYKSMVRPLLHPGIHTRQRMPTTLTKSSAALHVMPATATRSGPKDVSQQWLTH